MNPVDGMQPGDSAHAYFVKMAATTAPHRASRLLPSLARVAAAMLLILASTELATAAPAAPASEQRQALIERFADSQQPRHQDIATALAAGRGQWANLEGKLEVYYEDDLEAGQHRLRQVLITPSGERVELALPSQAIEHRFGSQVSASGIVLGSDDRELDYLLATTDGSVSSTTVSTAPLTQTTGDQKTLVILVNFQDDRSQPFTRTQVNQAVFGDVNAFMQDNSFGQLSLSGDIYGWFTLSTSVTSCDIYTIRDGGRAAASNAGANLAAYQRIVYIFPRNGCSWAGMGSVGGSTHSYVYLNGLIDTRVASHEVGHTLGLAHAHGLECGSKTVGTSCSNDEYADPLDVMGQRLANFDTFNMQILGWFENGDVRTAGSSGYYDLEPYAGSRKGLPKAIKIDRGIDAATGKREWLFVEFRTAMGYDSIINEDAAYDSANLHSGVVIRTGRENDINSGYLLDMTPASDFMDWFDPALTSGRSFTDPKSGIVITTTSVSGSSARIQVTLPGSTTSSCTTSAPAVSLTAIAGTSAAAGQKLDYRILVTNKDSANCNSATFDLAATVPSGWSKSLSATSLNLAPGAGGSATLSVTSAGNAIDGAYVIEGRATQRSSGKSAVANATYTVSTATNNTANKAPVAMNDSASTGQNTAITIPVLGNDSDPDGDALTLVAVGATSGKGSVSINADGTVSYNPHPKFTGTETFAYTISDGKLQASAQVAVTVGGTSSGGGGTTSPGKGGGNNGKGNNK